MNIDLTTPDGRRAAGFIALLGGSVVMTGFAAVGVYLTSHNPAYAFLLALAAHAQILIGQTLFGALFVKRSITVTKDSLEVSDTERRE